MTPRRSRVAVAVSLAVACAVGSLLWGCGEDGQSPACPPLSLYDVNSDASTSAQVEAERAAAVDAGCMSDLGAMGSCDRRAQAAECVELTGTVTTLADPKDKCTSGGAQWSAGTCPKDALLGCCDYTTGIGTRECFYTGTSEANPETFCETTRHGVWVPPSDIR